jgi:SAM-dependent methyltransferase
MRIRQVGGKPVNLLEIGYGTGSLTAQIVPWINYLTRPFDELGDLPPVDYYHAIDRAEQMRMSARQNLGAGATSWLRMLKKIAWREVRTDIDYDIIVGSLVMHFLIDRTVGDLSADTFFAECAKRLRDGGSLVFADSFGANSTTDRESAAQRWRDWMVRNGLSQEYADSFLKGNRDMVDAFSTEELKAAADRHGFVWGGERSVSSVREFKIIVLRKDAAQRNEPAT